MFVRLSQLDEWMQRVLEMSADQTDEEFRQALQWWVDSVGRADAEHSARNEKGKPASDDGGT